MKLFKIITYYTELSCYGNLLKVCQLEIVLAAARSKQIEIDLHVFSNLTAYSTFALKLTNSSTAIIDGKNTILVEIMMHRKITNSIFLIDIA